MILFNINSLFGHSQVISIITLTNYFICTQLNSLKHFYLRIILLNSEPLFAHI